MGGEISPFDTLLALSNNFETAKEHNNNDVGKIFVCSVETPSKAFISRPNKVFQPLYTFWGWIRKKVGWDSVQRYDQQANVQMIDSLFENMLNENLSTKDKGAVGRIVRFAIDCDTLAGTTKGRLVFANFLFGCKHNKHLLKNANTIEQIFELKTVPEQPSEALKNICSMVPALDVSQQIVGPVVDRLLSQQVRDARSKDLPLEGVWTEGKRCINQASLVLPENSEACSAVLLQRQNVTDSLIQSLFSERLSNEQRKQANAIADNLYVAKVTSCDQIESIWPSILRLKCSPLFNNLPNTAQAIADHLLDDTGVPLERRYAILNTVYEDLSPEQRRTIGATWLNQFEIAENGLEGLADHLRMLGGSESIFDFNVIDFREVLEGYKTWLHGKTQPIAEKDLGIRVRELSALVIAQDRLIGEIVNACPGPFPENLTAAFQTVNVEVFSPLFEEVSKSLEAKYSTYEEARDCHHLLTEMKGTLLLIERYKNVCIDRINKLLMGINDFIDKENPQAHVAPTSQV